MSLWFIEAKPTGARYVARREGNSYAWVGLRGSAAPPVDLVEVGRWVTDLGLNDPSGDRWRTRIGSAPGDRAGVPVCPALLDKYAEADGGPG